MPYTTPHPGEPDRDLTEAERLKATDLLIAIGARTSAMQTLLDQSRQLPSHSFEDRLLEQQSLSGELQDVIWAAWEEDS